MTMAIEPTSRKTKYLTTFVIYYCTFAVACAYMFLSPAVIDLSDKFDTSVDQVSKVFTIITASFVVGALVCGFAYKYVNRQAIVIFLLVVQSLALISTPFCPTLTLLFIAHGCIGFAVGGLDTAFVTWTIQIWQAQCGPYIMAHEFAFGLGIFMPPLIFEPFLADKGKLNTSSDLNMTVAGNLSLRSEEAENKINVIPYIVGSIILGVAAILQLIHLIISQNSKTNATANEQESLIANEKSEAKVENKMVRHVVLVSLSCLIIGFYMAEEFNAIEFLATFSVYSPVSLSQAQGARVLFVMTVTFAITRGIAIFLTFKVSSEVILVGNFVLIGVSNVMLLVWGQTDLPMLWTSSILMGIGLSTVFPCYFAFIQRYVEITDRVSSLILVFGGVASAVYPVLVGNSIEFNPAILCYINFLSIGVTTIAFAVVYGMTAMRKN